MKNDPIVEEIHQVRQRMLAEHGGDLESLMDWLQAVEAEHANRRITVEELRKLKRGDNRVRSGGVDPAPL